MKSFPITRANSTRRTSRRCSTSFARRVACAWIPNTTFLRWYLGLRCPEISTQEGSCHAWIPSILWSACTEDTAWKRGGNFSRETRTDGRWWIFILEVEELTFLRGDARWQNSDLSPQVKDVLRGHAANSTKYYDGDIVRQIRISTLRGDTTRRRKLLASRPLISYLFLPLGALSAPHAPLISYHPTSYRLSLSSSQPRWMTLKLSDPPTILVAYFSM